MGERRASVDRRARSIPYAMAWAAAIVVVVLLVGHDRDRLSAPFGPSHAGFNNAVYMIGGRAIVEDGPVESRLGAVSSTVGGDRVVYAHHPPMVYLADAVARAVPVSDELGARLPALAGSIVALALVVLALRDADLVPTAAAVGVLFAFATPMFLVFGAVTEPHLLGFGPMVALALVALRGRVGARAPRWVLVTIAATAALTSWLAIAFAVVLAAALVVLDHRRDIAMDIVLGVALGAAITAAWIVWANGGDLRGFADRTILRTGGDATVHVTLRQAIRQQMTYLSDLFPVGGWLVVGLAAAAVLDRRTRAVAGSALIAVAAYAIVFRNGAYDHSYWLYAVLLPVALGAAVTTDAAVRVIAASGDDRGTWRTAVGVVGALALTAVLVVTAWRPSDERRLERRGAALGEQVRAVDWPDDQRYALHLFGGTGPTDLLPWLQYYARRQPYGVATAADVPRGRIAVRLDGDRVVTVRGAARR